jgi:hypothetical protein
MPLAASGTRSPSALIYRGKSLQDAQKGQTSHPPNPGAPRRALSHARPRSAADPRFTFHASRFTVPGSEARTKLADFFSFLLLYEQQAGVANLFPGGSSKEDLKLLYGSWKCGFRFPE